MRVFPRDFVSAMQSKWQWCGCWCGKVKAPKIKSHVLYNGCCANTKKKNRKGEEKNSKRKPTLKLYLSFRYSNRANKRKGKKFHQNAHTRARTHSELCVLNGVGESNHPGNISAAKQEEHEEEEKEEKSTHNVWHNKKANGRHIEIPMYYNSDVLQYNLAKWGKIV